MADYFQKKLSDAQKAAAFAKKVLEVQARGQVENGNIDLASRPGVKNADGSESTVRSMSFNDGKGREVLVPTVVGGKVVSDDEAIANYRKTGQHMGVFSNPQDATAYAQKVHKDYENGKYGSNVKVNEHIERPAARSVATGNGYPRQERQETEEQRQARHNPAARSAWPPEKGQFVQEAKLPNDVSGALAPSPETLNKIHDMVPDAIRRAIATKVNDASHKINSVTEPRYPGSVGEKILDTADNVAWPKLQAYMDHVAEPAAHTFTGEYLPTDTDVALEKANPTTTIPEVTVSGNNIGKAISRVVGMGGTEGAPRLREPNTVANGGGAVSMERTRNGARYEEVSDADRGTKFGVMDTGPEQEDARGKDPDYEARKAGAKEYTGTTGTITKKNPQADRKVVQTAFDRAVKKDQ